MQKIATNFGAKLAVAFVSVAMLFTLATPAQAQTLEELQALIAQLQAQIAALSGGGSTAGECTFTASLTIGSQGAQVTCLQQYLVAGNYLVMPTGVSYGYFGPLTQAAVAKWQAANGVSPAVGYFGPISQAKYAMVAGSTSGGTTGGGTTGGSTTLNGGAGSIDEAQFLGAYNNEEVGEDTEDVEVVGYGIVADNSDLELTAVSVRFDHSVGTEVSGSATRLDKYADEVSIWLDGEEVARLDADDFTKDSSGVYSKTITLQSGAIIRDGDEGELVIAVSGASNLDSDDAGEEWGVRVSSVRYRDAQGAIITDSTTADFGTDRTFSFEDFATASSLGLKVRSGDSSINNAQTIEVSSTTKKNDVKILSFEVEIEGNADMNIDELTVDATTTNATLQNVVATAYLYMDGDKVGSESVTSAMATAGEFQFDDLDLDLDADETYDFEIRVDFQKATGSFVTGTTIDADVSSADVDSTTKWVVEDENGDTVAATDRSGSASADAHTLVTAGVNITLGSSSAVEVVDANSTAGNYGKFTMEVKVKAIGSDVYVLETAASSTVASSTVGLAYVFENTSGAQVSTASSTSGSFSHKSGGTVDGSSIRIGEGQEAIFEFVGTYDPTSAGQMRTRVVGVGFGTTNSGTGSSQAASPVSNYRSGNVFINN